MQAARWAATWQVPCPDERAGLYIRSRSGEVVRGGCRRPRRRGGRLFTARAPHFVFDRQVRAVFDSSSLAFQVGEVAQVHSGGLLRATPHCVRAAGGAAAAGVARNAFAVFMQPHWDAPMDAPPGVADAAALGAPARVTAMTFGEFAQSMLESYH